MPGSRTFYLRRIKKAVVYFFAECWHSVPILKFTTKVIRIAKTRLP